MIGAGLGDGWGAEGPGSRKWKTATGFQTTARVTGNVLWTATGQNVELNENERLYWKIKKQSKIQNNVDENERLCQVMKKDSKIHFNVCIFELIW